MHHKCLRWIWIFKYQGQGLFLVPVSFSGVESNDQIVNQRGCLKMGLFVLSLLFVVLSSQTPVNANEKLSGKSHLGRLLKAPTPGPPSPMRS